MKICIIDDNSNTALTLAIFFKSRGHEADYISVAYEAMDAVKSGELDEYDKIILDLYLNGISGIDLYNELTSRGQGEKVIFISGCDERSEIFLHALSFENVPMVVKTFDCNELLNRIEQDTVKEWGDELLEQRGIKRHDRRHYTPKKLEYELLLGRQITAEI